jgi:hypothetical protein
MAVAKIYNVPAPVGGLNGKDAVANMPETDGVIVDNWFPLPASVAVRNGYVSFATFSGNADTIMYYAGGTAAKLFVAVNNASVYSIYDATIGGALSTAAVGGGGNTIEHLSSSRFNYANFTTPGGQFLTLVNGTDAPLQFDGTTWTVSTITGSGLTPSNLFNVTPFKQRLWYIEKNTFNVWYLPIQSITGTVTKFNIGSYFKLGGSLQCMATWAVDNAGGLNDMAAFISTQGEVVVYMGYDPSSVSTWTQVGHFRVGQPVGFGNRCWTKNGSDALVIGRDGVFPLSAALLTDRSQAQNAISDKIRNLVNNDVATYNANAGWQIVVYPLGNKIIINMPQSSYNSSYQYVMNQITNAWCTFGKYNSPWNAFCFEVGFDTLYWGGAGILVKADTGGLDGSNAITADCKPAYSYLGQRSMLKQWTMVRPIISASGPVSYGLDLNVDFADAVPASNLTVSIGGGPLWTSNPPWNTSSWGGTSQTQKFYKSIAGLGYAGALRLRVSSRNAYPSWAATDHLYKPASSPF